MTRPTRIRIDKDALRHNLAKVRALAPGAKIQAMVKARAYGCGISEIVPVLAEEGVWAFGVACLEEAMAIRSLGIKQDCILMQGVFGQEELSLAAQENFQVVLHHQAQLDWLLSAGPHKNLKLKVWVKVNTGMNRIGFFPEEIYDVLQALSLCPWVEKPLGLFTHLAKADEPEKPENAEQLRTFNALDLPKGLPIIKSVANSAAIMALPQTHTDVVRPGIMLYGVSPFLGKIARDQDLQPVMHFTSAITAIHSCPAGSPIGYSGRWVAPKDSLIAVIPTGYGDGYPRHIKANTPVWINGELAPIVGRISMDMLSVDLSDCKKPIRVGDAVELWGKNLPVETIAESAGTFGYELLCQISPRIS